MLIIGSLFVLGSLALLFVMLDLVRPEMVPSAVRRRHAPSRATGGSVFVSSGTESLGRLRVLTVPTLIEKAERNIALAGYKAGWSLHRLMLVKVAAAGIVGVLFFAFFSAEPSGRRMVLFLVVTLLAFFYPDI